MQFWSHDGLTAARLARAFRRIFTLSRVVDRPDVFISYASAERPVVRLLYDRMVERHWRIFWDTTDIPPQARWEKVLLDQLRAARTIIVFWSQAALASEWVRREAEIGLT